MSSIVASSPYKIQATVVQGHTFTVSSRFEPRKLLGRGSFGVVCTAFDLERGELIAIKRIRPYANDDWDARHTLREIRLQKLLRNHPNIISLYDLSVYDQKCELYMVIELMDCDLHRIIQSKQSLSEAHLKCFAKQMLEGIKAMHSLGIFHRDIKPGNILVSKDCQLRITDFGLARFMDENTLSGGNRQNPMTEYVVTRWYRCPELLLAPARPYSAAVDIWSIGCIIGEMIRRKPLFPGKSHANQVQLILEVRGYSSPPELGFPLTAETRSFLERKCKFPGQSLKSFIPQASDVAINILEGLLQLDPAKRPSAEDALQHRFLQDAQIMYDYSKITLEKPSPTMFDFESEKFSIEHLQQMIRNEISSSNSSARNALDLKSKSSDSSSSVVRSGSKEAYSSSNQRYDGDTAERASQSESRNPSFAVDSDNGLKRSYLNSQGCRSGSSEHISNSESSNIEGDDETAALTERTNQVMRFTHSQGYSQSNNNNNHNDNNPSYNANSKNEAHSIFKGRTQCDRVDDSAASFSYNGKSRAVESEQYERSVHKDLHEEGAIDQCVEESYGDESDNFIDKRHDASGADNSLSNRNSTIAGNIVGTNDSSTVIDANNPRRIPRIERAHSAPTPTKTEPAGFPISGTTSSTSTTAHKLSENISRAIDIITQRSLSAREKPSPKREIKRLEKDSKQKSRFFANSFSVLNPSNHLKAGAAQEMSVSSFRNQRSIRQSSLPAITDSNITSVKSAGKYDASTGSLQPTLHDFNSQLKSDAEVNNSNKEVIASSGFRLLSSLKGSLGLSGGSNVASGNLNKESLRPGHVSTKTSSPPLPQEQPAVSGGLIKGSSVKALDVKGRQQPSNITANHAELALRGNSAPGKSTALSEKKIDRMKLPSLLSGFGRGGV